MSTLHRVSLSDAGPQPWRNGGGTTRELLAWPHGSEWLLRVSVATIAASGPFSPFPDVRRWFVVIDGAGVVLHLPGGVRTLVPGDDPVAFDGEAAPPCRLLEGATHDLNLMSRRDAGASRMWRAQAGDAIDDGTRWRGLYAASAVQLLIDDVAEALPAGTLLWSDARDAARWQLHHASGGSAWFMTLRD